VPSVEPIYHLALAEDWERAQDAEADYAISTIGVTLEQEGFIHCSYADQVQGVADRYYGGHDDVLLLTLDPSRLAAPWQVDPVGDEAYPHVYGPINPAAIVSVRRLARGPDGRLATGLPAIP
jgi:uncharacterized protein (DUF952 family)